MQCGEEQVVEDGGHCDTCQELIQSELKEEVRALAKRSDTVLSLPKNPLRWLSGRLLVLPLFWGGS